MSLRPRAGAPDPGRGGDGRRRRWSESPIPRVASRRVRTVGTAAPVGPCEFYDWTRTAFGSTYAEFTGSTAFVSLDVLVDYDCTHTGAVDIWVESVTTDGTSYAPTTAQTITGPDLAGSKYFVGVAGGGSVTAIRIEWDVAGALTACCVTAIDAS